MRSGQEIPLENGAFVFRGRGWGHGVGLSQWGAMAMAEQGWTAERILGHYYPGTSVKRFQ
jgi:stage II sporulation protein D